MAFKPLKFESGKLREIGAATTLTITKGEALCDNGSGYLTNVCTTAENIPFVAMQTVTTTANDELILVIATEGVEFEADTDAAVAQTDVGTLCDLATASTLNPDSSTYDVFEIQEIVGTAGTATKVRGKFRMQSNG